MKNRANRNDLRWYQFIFAHHIADLPGRGQAILFCVWNTMALLLSSAALCAVSLFFAIGRYNQLFYIYLGYLRTPEIFLLNWLPILLLQILLFAVCNRQWGAFLLTAVISLGMSIGNYYKLVFRNDPFTFSDLTSIRAGLSVAGEYDIRPDWRIMMAILFVMIAVLILLFFAKGRSGRWTWRIAILLLAVLPIWPLWTHIYSDGKRYYENSYKNYLFVTRDTRDSFIANGFFYPFLFSITNSSDVPPEGYKETETEKVYQTYQNRDIPENKKVNLMVIQLESFCDFEDAGLDGISKEVYAPLHILQEESISGTMVASVIGGGTITTEREVLTGSYDNQNYWRPAYSYVRYLREQGYQCFASHPNVSSFYSRGVVNEYLGFEHSYCLENYFQDITDGEWRCDATYLPEIFRLFREAAADGPVFSFNVSLQGHSPYNSDGYDRERDLWSKQNVSDSCRYLINNYLSSIKETQEILLDELEKIRYEATPVVVMAYGDHKPWFGDERYEELEIPISMETEKSMIDYLGTPYLIWANQSAIELLDKDFTGVGPLTSPGYMMRILFDYLGWEGPAFMQFTGNVMEQIPVICTKGGYLEEGRYTSKLSDSGTALLKQYRDMLYYIQYRPELAKSVS